MRKNWFSSLVSGLFPEPGPTVIQSNVLCSYNRIGTCDECRCDIYDGQSGYKNSDLGVLYCEHCAPTYGELVDLLNKCNPYAYGGDIERCGNELSYYKSQDPTDKHIGILIKERRDYGNFVLEEPKVKPTPPPWLPMQLDPNRVHTGDCVTCQKPIYEGDWGFFDKVSLEYHCEQHVPTVAQYREQIQLYVEQERSSKGFLIMFDLKNENKSDDELMLEKL